MFTQPPRVVNVRRVFYWCYLLAHLHWYNIVHPILPFFYCKRYSGWNNLAREINLFYSPDNNCPNSNQFVLSRFSDLNSEPPSHHHRRDQNCLHQQHHLPLEAVVSPNKGLDYTPPGSVDKDKVAEREKGNSMANSEWRGIDKKNNKFNGQLPVAILPFCRRSSSLLAATVLCHVTRAAASMEMGSISDLCTESECERKHKIWLTFPIARMVAKSNHPLFQCQANHADYWKSLTR